MKTIKGQKTEGSMTVETAIIFPLVMLCVVTVIYIGMMLYQQTLIQSMANTAAAKGAATWQYPQKDLFIEQYSKQDMKEIQPYWQWIDTNKEEKKKKVEQYLQYQMQKYGILNKNQSVIVDVHVADQILYKKLVVSVQHRYKIPVSELLKKIGVNFDFTMTAKAESVINEPAEFIRNTDFLLDATRQLDRKTGGQLQKLKQNIDEVFQQLMGKLESFLQ